MPLRIWAAALAVLVGVILLNDTAFAQLAHHPFAVGASEGAVGHQTGFGAWILGMESRFYLRLTNAVRAAKASGSGTLLLVGLSFAYGIFHAAGPGHGKAVITAYMVSNEVALRRGLLIALAAAILQGLVATAIVGVAAFVFNATAPRMTAASQGVELAGYIGIVVLGLMLVWRKGRALWAAVLPMLARVMLAPASLGLAFSKRDDQLLQTELAAPTAHHDRLEGTGRSYAFSSGSMLMPASRFTVDDCTHPDDCGCGHSHMPDPAAFAAARFDWRAASLAVMAAGARPCSGAILVLVFSLGQGLFLAGVAATFAMALGTAMTTGALAIAAVFAKEAALRISGNGSTRALIAGKVVEFGAAVCVLLFGLALLIAAFSGVHVRA